MLFAPMVSGALISTIGYYVPFMWLGAALATVGSGLLFSLEVDSPSSTLSAFQFITGLGLGICTQIPFNAVQYILPKEQMTMGSALVSFCNSLGPILGTNIGQAIFSNVFIRGLDHVPGVDAVALIKTGPTNLGTAETSPTVREAYNYALTRAFLLAVVSGGLAFACSMAMEWGNVKRERQHVKEDAAEESKGGSTDFTGDRQNPSPR